LWRITSFLYFQFFTRKQFLILTAFV
jgi:hypothetical protein